MFLLFRLTVNQQTPIKGDGGNISLSLGSTFATKLGFVDIVEWDGNAEAEETTESPTAEAKEKEGGKKKNKKKKKKKKVRAQIGHCCINTR